LRAKELFAHGQRLECRLFGIFEPTLQRKAHRQLIETLGHSSAVVAVNLASHGQRLARMRLRFDVFATLLKRFGQVIQARGDIRMLVPEPCSTCSERRANQ